MKNFNLRIIRSEYFVYILSLLLSVIFIFFVYATRSGRTLAYLFNADILFIPTLYKDIFIHGYKISSWYIPSAPNLFPDIVLYFTFMFISNNVVIASVLFGIIQYLIILMLFMLLVKTIFPKISFYHLAVINLLMTLFLLATLISNHYELTFLILSYSYHLGAFVMCLLALLFTFKYFKNYSIKYLIFLYFTGLTAIVSDKLFIILYCVPVLLSMFFSVKKCYLKETLILVGAIILMIVTGLLTFNLLKNSDICHIDIYSIKIKYESILPSFQVLVRQMYNYISYKNITSVITILSFSSLVGAIFLLIKNHKRIRKIKVFNDPERIRYFFIMFYVIFFIVVLFTPVLLGDYLENSKFRYSVFVFYLSIFNISLIASLIFKINTSIMKYSSFICILLLAVYSLIFSIKNRTIDGFKRVLNYYPDYVECVDEFTKRHNLKYGLADFWLAKVVTMFSRNDARVYQIHKNVVNLYRYVLNEDWYYGSDYGKYNNPVFNFILIHKNADLSAIISTLGQPLLIEECGSYKLVKVNDFKYSRSSSTPYFTINKNNISKEEILKVIESEIYGNKDTMKILTDIALRHNISLDSVVRKSSEKIYENVNLERYKREITLEKIELSFRSSESMLNFLREKADKRNISLDSMINLDAIWIYNNKYSNAE